MRDSVPSMSVGAVAVVSCHLEQPLRDESWRRFDELQQRRPGGFDVIALIRPPDAAHGEAEEPWLERARAAAARAPLGLHTHWTSPTHARPTGGDPAARVRAEAAWMRERGLEPVFFCGGGWYTDAAVREAVDRARPRRLHAARRRSVTGRPPDHALAGAARPRRARPAAAVRARVLPRLRPARHDAAGDARRGAVGAAAPAAAGRPARAQPGFRALKTCTRAIRRGLQRT